MDHSQAIEQMIAERYLLNELTAEDRDAFEEHAFDCPECAFDLRAAAAFVDEAKIQLPELTENLKSPVTASRPLPTVKQKRWLSWGLPAFAIPAFAALLLTVSYQNLVTLPALRAEASAPRLLPWLPLHGGTRGAAGLTITADRQHGIALPLDLSQAPGVEVNLTYAVELIDPRGKTVWTGNLGARPTNEGGSQRVLLAIPGSILHNGSYTVAVSGLAPHGDRVPIARYVLNLTLQGD